MKKIISTAAIFFFVGCATTESRVQTINTEIDIKEKAGDGVLGIRENQAILQEEVNPADELRSQQWLNNYLQNELASEYYNLKLCRRDLADPRLGGSGDITPLPEIDNMKPVEEVKEEFGIDQEGNLRIVKRSLFLKKLKTERRFEKTLRKMVKVVINNLEECEIKMRRARVKAGLPAERINAEGYLTPKGDWVELRRGEQNLDDAFELSSKTP